MAGRELSHFASEASDLIRNPATLQRLCLMKPVDIRGLGVHWWYSAEEKWGIMCGAMAFVTSDPSDGDPVEG